MAKTDLTINTTFQEKWLKKKQGKPYDTYDIAGFVVLVIGLAMYAGWSNDVLQLVDKDIPGMKVGDGIAGGYMLGVIATILIFLWGFFVDWAVKKDRKDAEKKIAIKMHMQKLEEENKKLKK